MLVAEVPHKTPLIAVVHSLLEYNKVGGTTIHKALHLSSRKKLQLDANGKTLASLRVAFRDVQIVLVDEKSLIHLEMLQWMDERLKQAKDNDQWFGGIHVVTWRCANRAKSRLSEKQTNRIA